MGILTAKGESTSINRIIVAQCMMPAMGELPPLLMLAAVLAMAPVAAKPPKSGERIFAMPCPISSWLELWCVPIILSATAAESSDSIAPNNAIVNAGLISSDTNSHEPFGK